MTRTNKTILGFEAAALAAQDEANRAKLELKIANDRLLQMFSLLQQTVSFTTGIAVCEVLDRKGSEGYSEIQKHLGIVLDIGRKLLPAGKL